MPPSARLETTDEARARTLSLAWGAAWRMVLWGAGLGAAFGGVITGAFFSQLTGMLAGAWIGVWVGGALGLSESIIAAAIVAVVLIRNPWMDPVKYRVIATRAAIVSVVLAYLAVTTAVTWAAGSMADAGLTPPPWWLINLIPATINALVACWESWRVAAWMVRYVIGEPEEPALPPRLASASHPQARHISRKKH